MFYTQCNNCNKRWELGTTNVCTCVTNGSATILIDSFSHLGQRTWVGLTDKEIEAIWKVAMFTDYGIGAELSNQPFVHYAKAIEAKLKEKNESKN
jgi:hypothetical protein